MVNNSALTEIDPLGLVSFVYIGSLDSSASAQNKIYYAGQIKNVPELERARKAGGKGICDLRLGFHGNLSGIALNGFYKTGKEPYDAKNDKSFPSGMNNMSYWRRSPPSWVSGDDAITFVDKNNAANFGQLLAKAVPFDKSGCVIWLAVCEASKSGVTFAIAKATGCDVKSTEVGVRPDPLNIGHSEGREGEYAPWDTTKPDGTMTPDPRFKNKR